MILRVLCTLLFFLCAYLPTQAFQRVDTVLTMSDGVRISAAYFTPDDIAPGDERPAIILVHGFLGTKNSFAWKAGRYADSGYIAMTYSVRGQGRGGDESLRSGGVFNWFTAEREMNDVREIIAWLGNNDEVRADRIAIEGTSQGGLTTWGAAINRMNVRCAVAYAAVPHYLESHAENGCNNYFTFNIFNLGDAGNLVEMGPFLRSVHSTYQQDNHTRLLELLAEQEVIDKTVQIEVPFFAQLAWHDDLFGVKSLYRAFEGIPGPKKMTVIPGTHGPVPQNFTWYRIDETFRFYRYWLLDDQSETIMDGDKAITLVDIADSTFHYFTADEIDRLDPAVDEERATRRFYFNTSGRLTEEPPTTGISIATLYLQNLGNNRRVFRSEPFLEDTQILGSKVSLVAKSSAQKWQLNALLYDRDPETNVSRKITRGSWQVRDGGAERRINYALAPQLYTIPAGHVLEVRLKYGTPLLKSNDEFGRIPYAPQATANTTFISNGENPSSVDIVLMTESTSSVDENVAENHSRGFVVVNSVVHKGEDFEVTAVDTREGLRIDLVNMTGNVCASAKLSSGKGYVNTGSLPSGSYVMVLRDSSQRISTKKVIVR